MGGCEGVCGEGGGGVDMRGWVLWDISMGYGMGARVLDGVRPLLKKVLC